MTETETQKQPVHPALAQIDAERKLTKRVLRQIDTADPRLAARVLRNLLDVLEESRDEQDPGF
jgi:hypothetical protein